MDNWQIQIGAEHLRFVCQLSFLPNYWAKNLSIIVNFVQNHLMRHLDLPGSEPHNIFSIQSMSRYFVRRTGGDGRIYTQLYESNESLLDLAYLDTHFEMGYTNLWVMERYALLHSPSQTWTTFKVFNTKKDLSPQSLHLINAQGKVISESWENNKPIPFVTVAQAQNYLKTQPATPSEYWLIALLLEDIMWHWVDSLECLVDSFVGSINYQLPTLYSHIKNTKLT